MQEGGDFIADARVRDGAEADGDLRGRQFAEGIEVRFYLTPLVFGHVVTE